MPALAVRLTLAAAIVFACAMLLPRAARADDPSAGGDVVEVIDESSTPPTPGEAPKPPLALVKEAPRADKFELRGFSRLTVAGGLSPARVTPDRAVVDDRVGYDRAAATQQAFLDLRYTRGKAIQVVVSGSLAYSAYLAENAAGAGGEGLRFDSGRPEAVLREAYLGIYGERLDLRIGQQRIVWGNSDGIRPNDVLNARDLRTRLQLDTELLDLPTLAARADLDLGLATLGLVVQPFFTPDRSSLYGGNWSLVQGDAPIAHRRLLGSYSQGRDRAEVESFQSGIASSGGSKSALDGASVGTSLRFDSGKVSSSFYYHWGLDRTPFTYLEPQLAAELEAADSNALNGAVLAALIKQQRRASSLYGGPLVVQYVRRHHIGADISTTAGPLVLRADAAYDSAATFAARQTLNSVARPTVQGVAGIEYQTGDLFKMVAFEAWYMRLMGPELPIVPVLDQANSGPLLFVQENNVGFANLVRWRLSGDFIVEVQSLLGLGPRWYMVRPEIGYNTSSFTIRAGLLVIDGEAGSFGGYYRRNDTAYLTARYSF